MRQTQYDGLHRRIEDTRKLRHDVRHHLLVVDSLIQQNDLHAVKEYLEPFFHQLADSDTLIYCTHYSINALLSYYVQQANTLGITFQPVCQMNGTVSVPDKDLTIVLGNLLENAMNACKKVHSQPPEINFHCRYDGHELILNIRNTTDAEPQTDAQGRYLSTSHAGHGVGIESVRSVVESYHGVLNIICRDGFFQVSVLLPAP